MIIALTIVSLILARTCYRVGVIEGAFRKDLKRVRKILSSHDPRYGDD